MAWTHLRFVIAMFWLTLGSCLLLDGSVRWGVAAPSFVLAGLAIARRSKAMPDRRSEGVLLWTVFAAFMLVLLVGGGIIPTPLQAAHVSSAVRNPAAIVSMWLVFAVLFWRRFYPAESRKNA